MALVPPQHTSPRSNFSTSAYAACRAPPAEAFLQSSYRNDTAISALAPSAASFAGPDVNDVDIVALSRTRLVPGTTSNGASSSARARDAYGDAARSRRACWWRSPNRDAAWAYGRVPSSAASRRPRWPARRGHGPTRPTRSALPGRTSRLRASNGPGPSASAHPLGMAVRRAGGVPPRRGAARPRAGTRSHYRPRRDVARCCTHAHSQGHRAHPRRSPPGHDAAAAYASSPLPALAERWRSRR